LRAGAAAAIMPRMSWRPTPSMAVALLALVIAMSGAAYAALKAPKNSVVSKSIRNGQVKRPDLGAGAVNGAKIADGSVAGKDIQDGSVGAGDLAPGAVAAEGPRAVAANPLTLSDPCDSGQTAVFCGYFNGEPDDGNWQNVGGGLAPVRFYRDVSGIVHLEGEATVTSYQTGSRAFILPAGYRPAATHLFGTHCWDIGFDGECLLKVEPDGDVWLDPNQDSSRNVYPRNGMSFGGVLFRAEG
jgi:hypothetical protein